MAGEKNREVTISRTLIPTLPPGYLSRKHLFPMIDNEISGSTFVIAPAGYGKSSLVAEWAQNQEKKVIWMTVANGDTLNEMSAMMIVATRRVVPNFAPWFEKEQPLRPTEVVRRWGNDLLQTGRDFVFILDNLRNETPEDVSIAGRLLEQFPRNVHFIAIRNRDIPEIYGVSSSRGPLKLITVKDLRFTDDEIESYAINSGLQINSENIRTLKSANGWPGATSLLRVHLQSDAQSFDIEKIMSSRVEPLRALAMIVIEGLDSDVKNICEALSVLEVFSLEQAEIILGLDFDLQLINSLAHRGEIFNHSRDPEGGFVYSPMLRPVFLEKLRTDSEAKNAIHKKLMAHFENVGQLGAAIDQAFQLGEQEKISELFPNAARMKQAQGRGGDLFRWAKYAGDSSAEGELKKLTVSIAGDLADLDFTSASSNILKLSLLAQTSPEREFFDQFAAGAISYSNISLGKFVALEESAARSMSGKLESLLGVDDQINILRLICVKRYIWSDADGVEEVARISQELVKQTSLNTSHVFNLAIQTMSLHQRGEYRRAYESAVMANAQFVRNGFVGNHGPLDVMYVMARCLLEFSRPQEALAILDQVRNMAYQWKQWHWYITSEKNILEFLTYNGNQRDALERINEARDFVATLEPTNQLAQLIDINEMNIRRNIKDYDRLEKLVNRAPDIRDTRQFRLFIDEFHGRKSVIDDIKKLPDSSPRDLIWKYLSEVTAHIDSEKIALASMRNAMKIGSEVGAKETFLRQDDAMGNLIIRIANDFPTVYNEELATAMAKRIKERGTTMTTGKPALTKRELEILRQLSTGRTLTVIAGELHISQNTMKTHLKNLYKKMEAQGRHDAVEKAKASFII